MATLLQIRDELNRLTELMSTRVQTLNAGIVGVVWAFSISDDIPIGNTMLAALGLALLSFAADFLQFVAAYVHQRRLESLAKGSTPQEAKQDQYPLLWRARFMFFDSKVVLSLVAAFLLAWSAATYVVAGLA